MTDVVIKTTKSSANKTIRRAKSETVSLNIKSKTSVKKSSANGDTSATSKTKIKVNPKKISNVKKPWQKAKSVIPKKAAKSGVNRTKTVSTSKSNALKSTSKKPSVKMKSQPKTGKLIPTDSAKVKTSTKRKILKKPVAKPKAVSGKTVKTKPAPKKVIVKNTVAKSKSAKILKPKTETKTKVIKPKTNIKTVKSKVTKSKSSKILKTKSVKKPIVKKNVSNTAKVELIKKGATKPVKAVAKTKDNRKSSIKTKKVIPARPLTTKEQLKKTITEAAAKKNALQKVAKQRKRARKAILKLETKAEQTANNNRKKPIRAITSAVFRGQKTTYDFKVYEINQNLGSVPAVFVISKRITDKNKRGHHSFVCIGQTESVAEALKNHRKSKCLRQNEANVISILCEENEKVRLKIAEDLKTAHSIACNQQ